MARGNGKTTLVAALAVAALAGPLATARGETVIVASSFDQAKISYEHVLAFLADLIDKDPATMADSGQCEPGHDRRPEDGGACQSARQRPPQSPWPRTRVLVVCDEPAQWPENTSEKMIAALRTSLGKIDGGRLIALGTRPAASEHWFEKLLTGGADYSQVHAARDADPVFHSRTWDRANPSLPYMPTLRAVIRREAEKARKDPAVLPAFRALRLNQGTHDVQRSALLAAGTWESIEGIAEASGPVCWAADLGTTAAMSAVAAYWPDTGRLEVLAAFPSEPSLASRGLRDGVGALYLDLSRRGELIVTPGRVVNVETLLREAMGRFGPPDAVAADRWREGELKDGLDLAGVPQAAFVSRGQGFKDGAEDVRSFRKSCLTGRVTPVESLLTAQRPCGKRSPISDPAGNEKLSKNTEGGRRSRARDDAAAAAILAVAVGSRAPEPEPEDSDVSHVMVG